MQALVAAAVVAPMVLAYVLRNTLAWWLPGLLPWGGAVVLYSMRDLDHPGDVGGLGAFGNGILTLYALGLVLYGVVLLVATYVARRRKPAR